MERGARLSGRCARGASRGRSHVSAKTYGAALSVPLPSFSIPQQTAGTSAPHRDVRSLDRPLRHEPGQTYDDPHSRAQLVPGWSLARLSPEVVEANNADVPAPSSAMAWWSRAGSNGWSRRDNCRLLAGVASSAEHEIRSLTGPFGQFRGRGLTRRAAAVLRAHARATSTAQRPALDRARSAIVRPGPGPRRASRPMPSHPPGYRVGRSPPCSAPRIRRSPNPFHQRGREAVEIPEDAPPRGLDDDGAVPLDCAKRAGARTETAPWVGTARSPEPRSPALSPVRSGRR